MWRRRLLLLLLLKERKRHGQGILGERGEREEVEVQDSLGLKRDDETKKEEK